MQRAMWDAVGEVSLGSRGGSPRKVTLEGRLKGDEGASHGSVWKHRILARGKAEGEQVPGPWAGGRLTPWGMAESKAGSSYEARGVMGKRSRSPEGHCKDFAEGWTLQDSEQR